MESANVNGCPECGNTRKLDLLSQKFSDTYNILIEKIDILNGQIPPLISVIQEQRIHMTALSTDFQNHKQDYATTLEKNREDHRQIHSKIERKYEELSNKLSVNDLNTRTEIRDFSNKIETKLDSKVNTSSMTTMVAALTVIFLAIQILVQVFK